MWILEVAPKDSRGGPHHIVVWRGLLLRVALNFT